MAALRRRRRRDDVRSRHDVCVRAVLHHYSRISSCAAMRVMTLTRARIGSAFGSSQQATPFLVHLPAPLASRKPDDSLSRTLLLHHQFSFLYLPFPLFHLSMVHRWIWRDNTGRFGIEEHKKTASWLLGDPVRLVILAFICILASSR